jgi:hypothetical protein
MITQTFNKHHQTPELRRKAHLAVHPPRRRRRAVSYPRTLESLTRSAAAPRLAGGGRWIRTLGPPARETTLRDCLLIEEVRFAADSPLEGDGFEPSVPRQRRHPSATANHLSSHHLPRKLGLRFAPKASTPSRKSSELRRRRCDTTPATDTRHFWPISSAIAPSRSRSVRLCYKNARSVTSGRIDGIGAIADHASPGASIELRPIRSPAQQPHPY